MDEFLDQIWGLEKLYIDKNLEFLADAQTAALILSVNHANFAKFISVEIFREIFTKFNLKAQIYGVQALQVGIINAIKKHKISKFSVLLNLEILRQNEILTNAEFENLNKFLAEFQNENSENSEIIEAKNFAFHKNIESLNEIAYQLCEISPNETIKNDTQNCAKIANENEFTISVTGVINAGKSSMLNAFLGAKILGTSNIPETANLTLLKFSQSPFAKVKFYTPKELEILGFDGKFSDKEIAVNELINYTSAKNEISKFIKMIELGVKNEILENNITIVDTPGLDDAVVLREELTKNFMSKSDAIIHLMNAAQSSTKKDMSFITNTLKNSKNSALIVVLTHADMLSQSELFDALKYAQKSISEELKSYDFSEDLISNVSFFCIDSVSGRGINELKNHLFESFFGANSQKANMILKTYAKDLALNCDKLLDELNYEARNLLGDKDELKDENAKISAQIELLKQNLSELNAKLNEVEQKFSYSDFGEFSALKSAALIIKDRIISDLKYAKNHKQKADLSRLKIIAESGVNDAFIDIFRAFSQKISKDIENFRSILGAKFSALENFSFDTKKFIDESFEKPDFVSFDLKFSKLINENSSDLTKFSSAFDTFFDEFLNGLNLKENFAKIAKTCSQNFVLGVKKIFENEQNELNEKEKILNQALKNSGENSAQIAQNVEVLKEKIAKLTELRKRIEKCY